MRYSYILIVLAGAAVLVGIVPFNTEILGTLYGGKKRLQEEAERQQIEKKQERVADYKETQGRSVHTKWYQGGTLHRSSVGTWRSATSKNRLATAGDIAAVILGASYAQRNGFDALKIKALQLVRCIDDAIVDGVSGNMRVAEVAAGCTILLGWSRGN